MRLIDADALKEVFANHEDRKGYLIGDWEEFIDNAPTIELDESVIQAVLNKRCMTAVANEYLIALHGKRPQGEFTIDELEMWLDEIAFNNDNVFGEACQEIVKRLDGFKNFVADMRKEEKG